MRGQAGDLICATGPYAVDVQRSSSAARPDVPRQDVGEVQRVLVGGSICHPEATIGRDGNVCRLHRASVSNLLRHAPVGRSADCWVVD